MAHEEILSQRDMPEELVDYAEEKVEIFQKSISRQGKN
jgi:hypothetical protein